jgi:hypothetical protein
MSHDHGYTNWVSRYILHANSANTDETTPMQYIITRSVRHGRTYDVKIIPMPIYHTNKTIRYTNILYTTNENTHAVTVVKRNR